MALQAPQLWRSIAEHLAKSSPEVLVLIHPIHMTPTSHSQRALSVGHLSPLHAHTVALLAVRACCRIAGSMPHADASPLQAAVESLIRQPGSKLLHLAPMYCLRQSSGKVAVLTHGTEAHPILFRLLGRLGRKPPQMCSPALL